MRTIKNDYPTHITELIPKIEKNGLWIRKAGYIFKVKPHEFGIEEKVYDNGEHEWDLYYGTEVFIGSINLCFGTYKVLWALTKKGLTSK